MNARRLLTVAIAISCVSICHAQDWPNSIAVIGDSISRGVFADDTLLGVNLGQPWHCWSTGWCDDDEVFSHYERILAENPGVKYHTYNVAESGADSGEFLEQANKAIETGAEYVTVFMGGNDVCKSSVTKVTEPDEYEALFREAMDALIAGLPDALVVVSAAPDVYHLYEVGKDNIWCRLKWNIFTFCDSILRSNDADRAIARAKNIEYNNRLSAVCAEKGLVFDIDTFFIPFTLEDMSEVDCFHPAASAHAMLADATYDPSRF